MRSFPAGLFLILALSACQPAPGGRPNETLPIDEILSEGPGGAQEEGSAPVIISPPPASGQAPGAAEEGRVTIEGLEGDLIQLTPEAVDPDGDNITYTFSAPFDAEGRWQTKEGDAGTHTVTITASDGKDTTAEEVLVFIRPTNKAPVIDCPEIMRFREGEIVDLDCAITDPEGDDIVIEYSGWMTAKTRETTFEDAGTHKAHIRASDPKRTVEKEISIIVTDTNRPPRLERLEDVHAVEGELVRLNPSARDLDGDDVKLTFTPPFDKNGEWQTYKGQAGILDVTVTASDGRLQEVQTIKVFLERLNTAPKVKLIPDITLFEGETVAIEVNAFDEEGDALTIAFDGWMTASAYTTTFEDAGEYDVKVLVSDGKLKTTQTVHITVLNKNRPPVFRVPA